MLEIYTIATVRHHWDLFRCEIKGMSLDSMKENQEACCGGLCLYATVQEVHFQCIYMPGVSEKSMV